MNGKADILPMWEDTKVATPNEHVDNIPQIHLHLIHIDEGCHTILTYTSFHYFLIEICLFRKNGWLHFWGWRGGGRWCLGVAKNSQPNYDKLCWQSWMLITFQDNPHRGLRRRDFRGRWFFKNRKCIYHVYKSNFRIILLKQKFFHLINNSATLFRYVYTYIFSITSISIPSFDPYYIIKNYCSVNAFTGVSENKHEHKEALFHQGKTVI